jgi:hypothetical protein
MKPTIPTLAKQGQTNELQCTMKTYQRQSTVYTSKVPQQTNQTANFTNSSKKTKNKKKKTKIGKPHLSESLEDDSSYDIIADFFYYYFFFSKSSNFRFGYKHAI